MDAGLKTNNGSIGDVINYITSYKIYDEDQCCVSFNEMIEE